MNKDLLHEAIKHAIMMRVEKEAELITNKAIDELRDKIPAIVAEVAIKTEEWVRIYRNEQVLTLEVKIK